jgi:hypothetical protein
MDIVTLAAVGVLVLERIIVHTFTAIKRCKSNCGCSSCTLTEKDHDEENQTSSTTRMEIPKSL